MRREPAIHVKLSSLISLLANYDLPIEVCKEIALELSSKSKDLEHRQNYIIKTERAVKPKEYKEITDSRLDYLFDVITSFRLKHKQIFKDRIFKKNTETLELTKIVDVVYDYAKGYYPDNIDFGVNEYIGKVFDFAVSNFNYNHINYYQDKIYQWKHNALEIENYALGKEKVIITFEAFKEIYFSRFKTNYSNEVGLEPNNLINFMYCFSDCVKHKAVVHDWLNAQFDAYDYLKKAPDIKQIHGLKALENYQKYMETKLRDNPSYGKIAVVTEKTTPKPSVYRNNFIADLAK